jgi:hypothetical protein
MARTSIVLRKIDVGRMTRLSEQIPVVEVEVAEEAPRERSQQSNRYEAAVDAAAVARKKAEQLELAKLYGKNQKKEEEN